MSYVGSSAAVIPVGFSGVNSQSFNGDGSTVAFTLNRPVSAVNAIEVMVNNVQQSPYDGSYSVSSTTLTFSAAPSSGTANIYVVYRDFPVGSITDPNTYTKAQTDTLLDARVAKSGDTMTGDLIVNANVGIGTSTIGSAGVSLSNAYNIGWTQSAGESIPNIFRQASSAATIVANGYRYTATSNGFASSFSSSFAKSAISVGDGSVRFYTDTAATTAAGTDVTPTERARITAAGDLMVGTTSPNPGYPNSNTGAVLSPNGISSFSRGGADYTMTVNNNNTGVRYLISFRSAGTYVGSIDSNGTSTTYGSASDYRLKEDWQPMTGATERVKALKPVNFAWKVDGSRVDGFLAHEAQAVVPEAVTGEKDAVDAEGNPVYQGIDQSKLVPLLTAALQEALAKIEDLTARVVALEGQP